MEFEVDGSDQNLLKEKTWFSCVLICIRKNVITRNCPEQIPGDFWILEDVRLCFHLCLVERYDFGNESRIYVMHSTVLCQWWVLSKYSKKKGMAIIKDFA